MVAGRERFSRAAASAARGNRSRNYTTPAKSDERGVSKAEQRRRRSWRSRRRRSRRPSVGQSTQNAQGHPPKGCTRRPRALARTAQSCRRAPVRSVPAGAPAVAPGSPSQALQGNRRAELPYLIILLACRIKMERALARTAQSCRRAPVRSVPAGAPAVAPGSPSQALQGNRRAELPYLIILLACRIKSRCGILENV
ncbi:unnamed protein product [Prorocentrum cordatum]|uniref:Uncharacterized protein n=2 Tax=Prorocentrum cordatum TaxID=2364126 RepID=A0ABN9R8C6_9DINO|nr:unnamed protein product [Polarella glacialis]